VSLTFAPAEPTASLPLLPPDTIQRILTTLDPSDPLTLSTLVTCQLVARSFSAVSKSSVVWRPLLALWNRGSPTAAKLPFPEDQAVLDAALAQLKHSSPSSAEALVRARTKIDRIALKHLDLLVQSFNNRIPLLNTISSLGS
jgi:hypothetical protein